MLEAVNIYFTSPRGKIVTAIMISQPKKHVNALAAGALPRTLLGSLQCSADPLDEFGGR